MVHVSSVFTQISPFTLDVTTNKYLYSAAGNAKIYLKSYSNSITPLSHSWPKQPSKCVISLISPFISSSPLTLFFSLSWTLFLPLFWTLFLLLSWTLFLPLSWTLFLFSLGTAPYLFTFLNSWVSTPLSQLGWFLQDAPAWVCQPSSLQYLCLHPPGSTFWSRSQLLTITHAQLITSCPFNLSVGQSCIHFFSPSLISNYPHQYPKSHNLGFHQYPLHAPMGSPSRGGGVSRLSLPTPFSPIFVCPSAYRNLSPVLLFTHQLLPTYLQFSSSDCPFCLHWPFTYISLLYKPSFCHFSFSLWSTRNPTDWKKWSKIPWKSITDLNIC